MQDIDGSIYRYSLAHTVLQGNSLGVRGNGAPSEGRRTMQDQPGDVPAPAWTMPIHADNVEGNDYAGIYRKTSMQRNAFRLFGGPAPSTEAALASYESVSGFGVEVWGGGGGGAGEGAAGGGAPHGVYQPPGPVNELHIKYDAHMALYDRAIKYGYAVIAAAGNLPAMRVTVPNVYLPPHGLIPGNTPVHIMSSPHAILTEMAGQYGYATIRQSGNLPALRVTVMQAHHARKAQMSGFGFDLQDVYDLGKSIGGGGAPDEPPAPLIQKGTDPIVAWADPAKTGGGGGGGTAKAAPPPSANVPPSGAPPKQAGIFSNPLYWVGVVVVVGGGYMLYKKSKKTQYAANRRRARRSH